MTSTSPVRVDVVTRDPGVLASDATGLPFPIQAIRLVVTRDGESRSHVVVSAAAPPWQLAADDTRIRSIFPADIVTCIQSEAVGRATVSSSSADDATMFAAAAATATLKRSWGWDESPAILVQFSTCSTSFSVNPVFQDGAWFVRAA